MGQSEPESDDNEGVFRISQSSSVTKASPSNSLGHSLWGSYLSSEMQSVYSTAPADLAQKHKRGSLLKIVENSYIYIMDLHQVSKC